MARPRTFDHDDVVARAMELFWRRGYGGASVRDLAGGVGVLPGSLYGAFGDKHALFLRALERYAEDTREAAGELERGRRVLPRIRALLTDVLDAAAESPGRGCMLGNTATESLPGDDAAAEVVGDALDSLEAAIERAIEKGRESGEVHEDVDAGAHARMLVALMQGLHVVARVEDDPHRLRDAIDAALAPLAA
jgi:TetR/AcrR family transcriptional repressor of nem operon